MTIYILADLEVQLFFLFFLQVTISLLILKISFFFSLESITCRTNLLQISCRLAISSCNGPETMKDASGKRTISNSGDEGLSDPFPQKDVTHVRVFAFY